MVALTQPREHGLGDPAQRVLAQVGGADLVGADAEPVATLLGQVDDEALVDAGRSAGGRCVERGRPRSRAIALAGWGAAWRARSLRRCSAWLGRGSVRSQIRDTTATSDVRPRRPRGSLAAMFRSPVTVGVGAPSLRGRRRRRARGRGRRAVAGRARRDRRQPRRRRRAGLRRRAALRRLDRLRRAGHAAHPAVEADRAAARADPLARRGLGRGGRARGRARADAAAALDARHRPHGRAARDRRAPTPRC